MAAGASPVGGGGPGRPPLLGPAFGAHVILSAHFRVKTSNGYDTAGPASIAWRHTRATPRGAPCCPATFRLRPAAVPIPLTSQGWRGSTPCPRSRPGGPAALLRQSALGPAGGHAPPLPGFRRFARRRGRGFLRPVPGGPLAGAGRRVLGGAGPRGPVRRAAGPRRGPRRVRAEVRPRLRRLPRRAPPEEQADQLLAAIRRRMGHEVDEERSISADELRRVAQARLLDLTRWLTSPDGLSATEIAAFVPVG